MEENSDLKKLNMKIFKWIIGTLIGFYILFNLIVIIVAAAFFGNNGTGKIEYYEFEMDSIMLKKELNLLQAKNEVKTLKDSIGEYERYFNFSIEDKKSLDDINYTLSYRSKITDQPTTSLPFYLIYVNGKINDDFYWFSLEKYRAIKLLEKTVIKPLSEKYKKHG